MVGDRLALLAPARHRRARPPAYDGRAGRAAADGGHPSGGTRALSALGGIAAGRTREPALRPADPGLLAPPSRQALARAAIWKITAAEVNIPVAVLIWLMIEIGRASCRERV